MFTDLKIACGRCVVHELSEFVSTLLMRVGRDSSVGIATRCRLDGPGSNPGGGGARFSAPVQTGPGAYPTSCTMGTGSFPGVKRPGRGADHPPPSKCRGHERVGLYLYSPSGPLWPVIGRTLTLYIYSETITRKVTFFFTKFVQK